MASVFILIGLVLFPDGPFIRPHPLLWRFVLAASVTYQLFITFLLFQNVSDARSIFKFYDSSLGSPLPERNYADECDFTWTVIRSQLDEFVLAHVFGWVAKAILFRDYWICWVLSIMFEVLEYSLQHQLPNFAECWWDHWILDVLVCNWLGLELGMHLCSYFEMKTYSWRGIRQISSYTGKVKRAVAQFTPYSFTKFDWQVTKDIKHFLAVLCLITVFLQGELNAFYLKYLLWIPPRNPLNTYRLILFFFAGCPAIREVYQYVSDPECRKLGPHAWICIANILTELLVCYKFGQNEFHEPFPQRVVAFWILFAVLLAAFVIWQFLALPLLNKMQSPSASAAKKRK